MSASDFSFTVSDSAFKVPSGDNIIGRRIMSSSIAGSWYPADPLRLHAMLQKFIEDVPASSVASVDNASIFIVPHAGYAYSGQSAAYCYSAIKHSKKKFKRVFLIAPSHRNYLENTCILPECDAVSTPLGDISIDDSARRLLLSNPLFKASDAVHKNEHATQIQYPFIQTVLDDSSFTILPVITGETDVESAKKMAEAFAEAADDETLFIISSDFTHYGRDFNYMPFGKDSEKAVRSIDFGAFELIKGGTPDEFKEYTVKNKTTICGANPIFISMFLKSDDAKTELLDYRTSADDDRDFSRFVCYLACAITTDLKSVKNIFNIERELMKEQLLTPNDKIALLKMARKSIRYRFTHGHFPPADEFIDDASDAMKSVMGAFVTLKMKHNDMLRGCIGEIEPYRPLYKAVTARACDAAFRDPRFQSLTETEFGNITIEISALTPPHAVSSWRDIVIGKHGMTITKYGRSAVFLPQVAPEQGWDIAQTLTQLSLKAGLRADDWRDGADFSVFEAIVFNEEDEMCEN